MRQTDTLHSGAEQGTVTLAPEAITGRLVGATFRLRTTAPDLAAYAPTHLAPLLAPAVSAPSIDVTLRWHEGQPPRDRLAVFPDLVTMERVDRDLYVSPGRLRWFRVDDLRDLYLHLTWQDGRLIVQGDFFYRMSNNRHRDRARRLLFNRRRAGALRRRRFTTLLHYFIYYPCWWWLEQMQGLHPIHAAGIRVNTKVILLGGASGVGKSTLALALATMPRARLLSDSFVLHSGADAFAVREPILLDAWSRQWLGPRLNELQVIDWRYAVNRTGYQLPPNRLAAGGRAGLLVFPRRAPDAYVRRISSEQAHQRMSTADFIVKDLRRYWAFTAIVEQIVPGHLIPRRETDLARLTAEVPCYEVGLTEHMSCTAAVEAILQLLPDRNGGPAHPPA